MPNFAVFELSTGRILRTGSVPEEYLDQQALEGEGVFVSNGMLNDELHYILNWKVAVYPSKPGPWAEFDYDQGEWVDPRTPEEREAQERLARVPREITVMQAMITVGEEKWAEAMAVADDPEYPWAMRAAIKGATILARSSETVDALGWILGYSAKELDQLFIDAYKVRV